MESYPGKGDSMLFYEKKRDALIVRLTGELDHSCAAKLRDQLDALIRETGTRRLVFDLSGLEFMDSSGVGLIIGRYKLMHRRGGSVAVYGYDARMDKVFRMSGLYRIVERLA